MGDTGDEEEEDREEDEEEEEEEEDDEDLATAVEDLAALVLMVTDVDQREVSKGWRFERMNHSTLLRTAPVDSDAGVG